MQSNLSYFFRFPPSSLNAGVGAAAFNLFPVLIVGLDGDFWRIRERAGQNGNEDKHVALSRLRTLSNTRTYPTI